MVLKETRNQLIPGFALLPLDTDAPSQVRLTIISPVVTRDRGATTHQSKITVMEDFAPDHEVGADMGNLRRSHFPHESDRLTFHLRPHPLTILWPLRVMERPEGKLLDTVFVISTHEIGRFPRHLILLLVKMDKQNPPRL